MADWLVHHFQTEISKQLWDSCTDIHDPQKTNPTHSGDPHTFVVLSEMSSQPWTAMQYGADIHVPVRFNFNTFGELFYQLNIYLSNILLYDQLISKEDIYTQPRL